MTTTEKQIKNKLGLLEFANNLKNVSEVGGFEEYQPSCTIF
ncbi:hypothetical protein ACFL9T_10650 [Thermodesulfobacteriota bacterium]